MEQRDVLPAVTLAVAVFITAAFTYTWKTNPKTTAKWHRLNALVLVVLLTNIVSTFCQLLAIGRTLVQCRVLQSVFGNFYMAGTGAARIFFAARFAMVSPASRPLVKRGLVGSAAVFTLISVILVNLTARARIDLRNGVCVYEFGQQQIIFSLIGSLILDLATTVLFVGVLMNSTTVVDENTRSPGKHPTAENATFLTRVTIILCFFFVVFSLIPKMMVFGIISADLQTIVDMFELDHLVTAAATALPAIAVRIRETRYAESPSKIISETTGFGIATGGDAAGSFLTAI
jgi:hypothetical protein